MRFESQSAAFVALLAVPAAGDGEAGQCATSEQATDERAPGDRERGSGSGQLPNAWFQAHFARMWRLAARLGIPGHSVDDVVQEAFIVASRRRADIAEGQEQRFLLNSVIKICSNYRRRSSVRHESSQTPLLELRASPLPDAEQILAEKRARLELDAALDKLSEAHRTVFVLYELEELNVPEISELLDIPAGTVASRLNRARAHFSRTVERLSARRENDEAR
jgi:RNA polymerase sigma-70 factor (ECF subfamily)